MSRMFDTYNKVVHDINCSREGFIETRKTNLKVLSDISGKIYGIEAPHLQPFILYCNLVETSNQSLDDFIKNCLVEFRLYSKGGNHKLALEKIFSPIDKFNSYSRDLVIEISAEEAVKLKQETYYFDIKLTHSSGCYRLFSEKNSPLLVVR